MIVHRQTLKCSTQNQNGRLLDKMLMCDVAYEQGAQRALKERKKNIEKEIEQHWQDVEKQKMSEYDEKMKKKLEQEYNLRQENSKNISDQLE